MKPYYADSSVTLWHGNAFDVLPTLEVTPDSCVTDPPYGETTATWDRWQDGWVKAVGDVLPASASLWCFGSARMFLDHVDEFAGWKFAQEQLWLKHNGTGPGSRDRLQKVHEWAYHWYRGRWTDLHHAWEREAYDGPDKGRIRKNARAAPHQRHGRATQWLDDGTRQRRSVIRVVETPSVRYGDRHQDEKPLATVVDLVRECTPPGGLVLDVFAGVGTVGVAAQLLGCRAVLIEADERHCEDAARRLAQDCLPIGATP